VLRLHIAAKTIKGSSEYTSRVAEDDLKTVLVEGTYREETTIKFYKGIHVKSYA
jgi:hypothetical protein